jgi:hypothetical protein
VLEEAPLRCRRKAQPDLAGERPDAVDHAAPIAATCHLRLRQMPEPAERGGEIRAERHVRGVDPERLDAAVRPRQQPAPGHRHDRPAMAAQQQRKHIVDHRQAGPENEDRCVRGDAGIGRRAPGIGIAALPDGWNLMPGCKNRHMRGVAAAICEHGRYSGTGLADPDAFALDDVQPARLLAVGQQRLDQARDVVAVDLARNETEGVGARRASAVARTGLARVEPAPEVIGIFGQRAHVGRAHIEQVRRIRAAIGDAAADLRTLLDQGHVKIPAAVAEQPPSQENTACAAANDDHMSRGISGHECLLACRRNETAGESAQDYS